MNKYNNNHFRIDLSNIINRLPVLRQINASQTAIINFTPAWDNWAAKNLPESFRSATSLNSFNEGVLSIQCTTPIAASQLKHQQVSILEALHNADHYQILSLKIQIDHQTSQNSRPHAERVNLETPKVVTREALSQQAIDNINNCQRSVKNERLSDSLKRLSETLKKEN